MPTLKTKIDMEKPPALNEHQEYQSALKVFSAAVAAHRRAEQTRSDWERRCQSEDEVVRGVASLERPNIEEGFWQSKVAMDKARSACDRVQQEAKQPLHDYYVERDRELVQRFYAALHTIIPLNNAIQQNWLEAQHHDVPIEQHFWHELLENIRDWTSLLEHRKARLKNEGVL